MEGPLEVEATEDGSEGQAAVVVEVTTRGETEARAKADRPRRSPRQQRWRTSPTGPLHRHWMRYMHWKSPPQRLLRSCQVRAPNVTRKNRLSHACALTSGSQWLFRPNVLTLASNFFPSRRCERASVTSWLL